jgi:hypothetical protein
VATPLIVDENAQINIVVPTAINMVLMVNENLISNLRLSQPSDIVLPSMYKRAYLVVNETDEIATVKQTVPA